jgi:hypothetical protein
MPIAPVWCTLYTLTVGSLKHVARAGSEKCGGEWDAGAQTSGSTVVAFSPLKAQWYLYEPPT